MLDDLLKGRLEARTRLGIRSFETTEKRLWIELVRLGRRARADYFYVGVNALALLSKGRNRLGR